MLNFTQKMQFLNILGPPPKRPKPGGEIDDGPHGTLNPKQVNNHDDDIDCEKLLRLLYQFIFGNNWSLLVNILLDVRMDLSKIKAKM